MKLAGAGASHNLADRWGRAECDFASTVVDAVFDSVRMSLTLCSTKKTLKSSRPPRVRFEFEKMGENTVCNYCRLPSAAVVGPL